MRDWIAHVPLHLRHGPFLQVQFRRLHCKRVELAFCLHEQERPSLRVSGPEYRMRNAKVHATLAHLCLANHLGRRLQPGLEVVHHFEGCRGHAHGFLAIQDVADLRQQNLHMYDTVGLLLDLPQHLCTVAVPNVDAQHAAHGGQTQRKIINANTNQHCHLHLFYSFTTNEHSRTELLGGSRRWQLAGAARKCHDTALRATNRA